MKILFRSRLPYAIITVALLFACGCGSSSNTAPTVSSSQDELTKYLDEHPELKDVKEDTVTASGGT